MKTDSLTKWFESRGTRIVLDNRNLNRKSGNGSRVFGFGVVLSAR